MHRIGHKAGLPVMAVLAFTPATLSPHSAQIRPSRSIEVLKIRLSIGAAAQSLPNVMALSCDGGSAEYFFPS